MSVYKRVNCRYDALISEIKLKSSLFLLESSKTAFKLFVQVCLACHHSAAHRISKTPFGGSFCIYLTDFRMICKSKIVIEAPAEDILAIEPHVWT